eukprot:6380027-Pyramimonas_sp.AAC.1
MASVSSDDELQFTMEEGASARSLLMEPFWVRAMSIRGEYAVGHLDEPRILTEPRNLAGSHIYDVCIVGAGPHGLSVLSALHSPFSALTEQQRLISRPKTGRIRKPLSVCVVDPSGEWLSTWNRNFSALDIKWLRSPLLAHPDANDAAALLEYAK